ncbi:hypothetical protein SH661x_001365 [Planctomicrobium sp. SH661]|uniref:hypothetical protein n=1 Tax=Planctomicrobium sp. SH661 TaxID=3448124 RepID=UPI003F5C13CB
MSKILNGSLAAFLAMATLASSSSLFAQVAAPREIKQQRGQGAYEQAKRARAGYPVTRTTGPVMGAPRYYDRVNPTTRSAPVYVQRSAPVNRTQQQPAVAAPGTVPVEHNVARPIQPNAPVSQPNAGTPVQ